MNVSFAQFTCVLLFAWIWKKTNRDQSAYTARIAAEGVFGGRGASLSAAPVSPYTTYDCAGTRIVFWRCSKSSLNVVYHRWHFQSLHWLFSTGGVLPCIVGNNNNNSGPGGLTQIPWHAGKCRIYSLRRQPLQLPRMAQKTGMNWNTSSLLALTCSPHFSSASSWNYRTHQLKGHRLIIQYNTIQYRTSVIIALFKRNLKTELFNRVYTTWYCFVRYALLATA